MSIWLGFYPACKLPELVSIAPRALNAAWREWDLDRALEH